MIDAEVWRSRVTDMTAPKVFGVFDAVYVINLPERADRRREMAEQFAKVDLSFEHTAVRLFEAVRPDAPGEFPSIGARGCFMSHLGVLQDAAARGFERIMIAEDDLNFARDFAERIGAVASALGKTRWDVFYGGYLNSPVVERLAADEPTGVVASEQGVLGAHFIAFQGSAVAETVTFLELLASRRSGDARGGPMHVDGAYNWYRAAHPERQTLAAAPPLGYQRSSRTDISDSHWLDRYKVLWPMIGGCRAMKNWVRDRTCA